MPAWWLAPMVCVKATLAVMWLQTMTGKRDSCQPQHDTHTHLPIKRKISEETHVWVVLLKLTAPSTTLTPWQQNGIMHWLSPHSELFLGKLLSWVMTIPPPSLLSALSGVSTVTGKLTVYVRLTPPQASLTYLAWASQSPLSHSYTHKHTDAHAHTHLDWPQTSRLIVRGQTRCINSFIIPSKLPALTSFPLKKHKVIQCAGREAPRIRPPRNISSCQQLW